MRVSIGGYAWLNLSELEPEKLHWLKKQLTLVQKISPEYSDRSSPATVECFVEDQEKGRIGIARQFFFDKVTRDHEISYEISSGDPWPERVLPEAGEDGQMPNWSSQVSEDPRLLTFFDTETGTPVKLKPEQETAMTFTMAHLSAAPASGGIVQAPTAWGKTIFALALIRQLQVKTAVLVHRKFLMDQWANRIKRFMPDAKIGMVYGRKYDIEDKHIVLVMIETVASWAAKEKVREGFGDKFGLVVADECVDGGALVDTDLGRLPLCEVVDRHLSKKVLSFNETLKSWEFRRIVRRWKKGKKPTFWIVTRRGRVRTTGDHLFFTDRGWIAARDLTALDRILNCVGVSVGAERGSQREIQEVDRGGLFLATNRDCGHLSIGNREPLRSTQLLHCVNVVVEEDCLFQENKSEKKEHSITNGRRGLLGTTAEKQDSGLSTPERSRSSWGLFSETRVLVSPIVDLLLRGSFSTMDRTSLGGEGIRRSRSHFLDSMSKKSSITGLASVCCDVVQKAIQTCLNATNWPSKAESRRFPESGLTNFLMRLLPGGISTMDLFAACLSPFTRKGSQREKSPQSVIGSERVGSDAIRGRKRENTGSSNLELIPQKSFCGGLDPTSQSVCHTSWEKILAVQPGEETEVYDLEVEGNHNFVANGVLVHNCHRVGAPTWSKAISVFNAAKRLGISARPKRSDGLDKCFFYHIGPKIFSGQVMQLVPLVKRVWTTYQLQNPNLNPDLVSKDLAVVLMSRSVKYNEAVVDQILRALEAGRKLLIFSESLEHLRRLKADTDKRWRGSKAIKTDYFIGGMQEEDLAEAEKADAIFATYQMCRDALDIPPIDTVVLATPIRNPEQPVGRCLRPFDGKKQPVVVDIRADLVPICKEYGVSRDNMYEKLYSNRQTSVV